MCRSVGPHRAGVNSRAVPLSSVRQPRQLLGRTAAQLLLDEALGEETHQHQQVVFEPELVVRRSSEARARGRG
jgi:LacI family transcriptional regulator